MRYTITEPYREYGFGFYKFQSETDYICVDMPQVFDEHKTIGISIIKNGYPTCPKNVLLNGRVITKEKFEEVLDKALSHINHAVFMQSSNVSNEVFQLNEHLQDSLNNIGNAEIWNVPQ